MFILRHPQLIGCATSPQTDADNRGANGSQQRSALCYYHQAKQLDKKGAENMTEFNIRSFYRVE